MIGSLVTWTIISLILILLAHHLFNFFKDTLTVPKVKDLVRQPNQSYKDIDAIIKNKSVVQLPISEPEPDANAMKDELKNFFKELRDNKTENNEANDNTQWGTSSVTPNLYTEIR